MNKSLFYFILLFIPSILQAQTITFLQQEGYVLNSTFKQGIGTLDIGEDCKEEWLIDSVSFPFGVIRLENITYHPDNNLYTLAEGTSQQLHTIDIDQELLEYYSDFDGPGIHHMKSNPDGEMIMIALQNLHKYTQGVFETEDLGLISATGSFDPSVFMRGLTFINGELYVIANTFFPTVAKIIKINLQNPSNSTVVFEFPFSFSVVGITTFNYDCDSSLTYIAGGSIPNDGSFDFYLFDEKSLSLTFVCNQKEVKGIKSLTNPTEHRQFDCVPILDLNEPDISSFDYQTDTICIASKTEFFPLQNAFPAVLTNTVIDSIWIGIVEGDLDGTDEYLGCNGNSFASCNTSNNGIMIYNNGQVNNEEFLDWARQSIFYQNDAHKATGGIRKLAFVGINKGYESDTVYLWMPVESSPNAGINTDFEICKDGDSVQLFELLNGTPHEGGSWSSSTISGDYWFNPSADLSGSFQYIVESEYCSVALSTLSIQVNDLPQFSLGPDLVLCSGEEAILETDILGDFYLWQDGSATITQTIHSAGEYWLELTDESGCKWRDSISASISDDIYVDSFLLMCEDEYVVFHGEVFTEDTILCTVNNSFEGCDSVFCLNLTFKPISKEYYYAEICENEDYNFHGKSFSNSGIYADTLTSIDGCDSLIILELIVIPTPSITIEGKRDLCEWESIELNIVENYEDYHWSTGEKNPMIIVGVGNYQVTVTNESGCTNTETIEIPSKSCEYAYIPNAFSPNGDQANDEFRVYPNTEVKVVSMKIFDRWGRQVFDGKENEFWDGSFKGKEMKNGVYIYKIELVLPNGQKDIKQGSLVLIR